MKKVQKGFTLVELIVVITILAILGTIAFISLQGYSQDAKNSKVTSDIRTLTSAIETSLTDGTVSSIDSAVSDNGGGNDITSGNVADGRSIAAADVSSTGTGVTAYEVGTVNFAALRQNDSDFKYSVGNLEQDYLMAAVKVAAATDLQKGAQMYQIAGVINEAGTPTPVVKGNYVAYDAGDLAGIIADSESTTTAVENSVTASMSGSTLY